jgi:HSP20 family protein
MTVTTSWDLFDDLHAAQDELQRFTAGRNRRPVQRDEASGATVWAPAVDICELGNAYLVTAEIPGVSADDVEVTFDGLLTIQGERHPRDGGGRRAGPPVRAPARQVPPLHHVASHVEADKIEASAQDGVLQASRDRPGRQGVPARRGGRAIPG